MPELPEVETVRRSLERHLPGRRISDAEILHPKTARGDASLAAWLRGKTFARVERRAKLLVFRFEGTEEALVAHLKMTGQFLFQRGKTRAGGGHSLSEAPEALPNRHTRAVLRLEGGGTLYFNDMRLFGYLRRQSAAELAESLAGYGAEPGTAAYTPAVFAAALGRRTAPLKAVLLDQSRIAGLGNIYVDEACWLAGVRPTRRAGSLTRAEREKLFAACATVLEESVALGGTTFRSYSDADGRSGGYLEKLRVYGREGEACPRCGGRIAKVVCAGRGTHFCRACQK